MPGSAIFRLRADSGAAGEFSEVAHTRWPAWSGSLT